MFPTPAVALPEGYYSGDKPNPNLSDPESSGMLDMALAFHRESAAAEVGRSGINLSNVLRPHPGKP
jgi:hypothetical protein